MDEATAEQSKNKKNEFWWFQGASRRELARRLAAAGDHDHVRLEVRLRGDKMTLRVVRPPSAADASDRNDAATIESHSGEEDINDSHLCRPPRNCPP